MDTYSTRFPPPRWSPNPDENGNNQPPCPRCARKGPHFITRYHPCKGNPCGPCKKRTRKYDGTGGLTAYQCATDTGGTPPHQQKPHKVQRRNLVYGLGGVEFADLSARETNEIEHPGVGMGYTEEEMQDVCEGCLGWEWCFCECEEEEDGSVYRLDERAWKESRSAGSSMTGQFEAQSRHQDFMENFSVMEREGWESGNGAEMVYPETRYLEDRLGFSSSGYIVEWKHKERRGTGTSLRGRDQSLQRDES